MFCRIQPGADHLHHHQTPPSGKKVSSGKPTRADTIIHLLTLRICKSKGWPPLKAQPNPFQARITSAQALPKTETTSKSLCLVSGLSASRNAPAPSGYPTHFYYYCISCNLFTEEPWKPNLWSTYCTATWEAIVAEPLLTHRWKRCQLPAASSEVNLSFHARSNKMEVFWPLFWDSEKKSKRRKEPNQNKNQRWFVPQHVQQMAQNSWSFFPVLCSNIRNFKK